MIAALTVIAVVGVFCLVLAVLGAIADRVDPALDDEHDDAWRRNHGRGL